MPGQGHSIAAAERKIKAPKVLHHLEVHPRLEGGHIVQHHYMNFQHDMEPYEFTKSEGHAAMKHIAKHAGLPHPEVEEQEESEPEPYE